MGYLKDRVKTKRSKVMIGIIILLSLYKGVLVAVGILSLYLLWLSYEMWMTRPIKTLIWMMLVTLSILWCYWLALSQFGSVFVMVYDGIPYNVTYSSREDESKLLTSYEYPRKAEFNNKYVYNEEQQIEVYRYNPMVRCPWGLSVFPWRLSLLYMGICEGFETPERYWRDLNTQKQLIKLFSEGCIINDIELKKCRRERNWYEGKGVYYRYILLTHDETAEVKSAIAVKLQVYEGQVEVIEAKELSSLQWLLVNGVF